MAAQDRADRAGRHAQLIGDPLLTTACRDAQRDDSGLHIRWCAAWATMGTRGPINQPGSTLIEKSAHPSIDTLPRHTQFGGHVSGFTSTGEHAIDEKLSTVNGQPSITVRHEDLRARVETSDISTKPGGPPFRQLNRQQCPCRVQLVAEGRNENASE